MKQQQLKEFLREYIKEEYKGFKKDQNFRLKPEQTDDSEEGEVPFEKVQYLPKFDKIRRDLRKYSGEFKGYKTSPDPNISDLAKDIAKTINQLGQLIYILDQNLKQKGIR